MNMNDTHQEGERLKYWERQQALLEPVYSAGFAAVFRNLNDPRALFTLRDRTLRCIDEGTPGGIHCPGSGILRGLEEAIELVHEARVDTITSHAGCGAAALVGIDAVKWSRMLAERTNLPYQHISFKEMRRSRELHHARVVAYDATGVFSWTETAGLPAMFQVSRWLGALRAEQDALLAFSIATGSHGYGERMISSKPGTRFVLLAIGDSRRADTHPDVLVSELASVFNGVGDHVLIDRLDAALYLSSAGPILSDVIVEDVV